MRYLAGAEKQEALGYLHEAVKVAQGSKCLRSRCGSILVNDGDIIGRGYNSPPQDKTLEKCLKDDLPDDFKSDKTCCVHSEQRVVKDALRNNPERLPGSRLYFVRTDLEGNVLKSGDPYCTICSKDVLDEHIAEFVLWHNDGIAVYDTSDYNKRSFAHRRQKSSGTLPIIGETWIDGADRAKE